jgi:cation:H+ antiporter
MIVAVGLLLLSAGAIYLSCEAFVNGVEWLGRRLKVGRTATGTILAAFGTALPESVVTLMATAFSSNDSNKQIGIGAALGGPLALSTVAYGIVGICIMVNAARFKKINHSIVNNRRLILDCRRLSRDQAWFLLIFAVKIALGTVAFAVKPWLGLAFLAAYAGYFRVEMRNGAESGEDEELEPLRLRPCDCEPALGWILLQTLPAIGVIFAASHVFVGQLGTLGAGLGLSPQLTALVFSPIATELPEIMNAIIWVRQGKESLALANISGSMMIQATIPTAFGLFFTPWRLDPILLVAAGLTALAVLMLFLAFRRARATSIILSQTIWFYAAFALIAVLMR